MDLIKKHKWSVSCSYDVLKADDEGGSENNIKYGREILDGEFKHLAIVKNPRYERANIVFNSKTQIVNGNPDQPRVPAGNPNGGQFAKTGNSYLKAELPESIKEKIKENPNDILFNFIDQHKNEIEKSQTEIEDVSLDNILKELNITEEEPRIVKTAKNGDIKITKSYIEKKVKKKNEKERGHYLKNGIATLERPNDVFFDKDRNRNVYVKLFVSNKLKMHLTVVEINPDGDDFIVTNHPISELSDMRRIIKKGQVQNDLSREWNDINNDFHTYIINDILNNLNPNVKNNKETFEEAFTDVFFEALAEVLLETYK